MSTVPKPTSSQSIDNDEFEDKDELAQEFSAASNHLRKLTDTADPTALLYLYARFKQATEGPCQVPKPGMFDLRGKQKWDAWKALGDLDKNQAMTEYIKKIKELDPTWTFESGKSDKKAASGGFGVGVSRPVAIEKDDVGVDGPEWLTAVTDGNLDMLKTIQKSNPSVFLEPDSTGMTALHWAADRGHSEILKWLIQNAGIGVNTQDSTGQTPLHYAYACGHQEIVKLLLSAGADESIVDQDGNKPCDLGESS